MLLSLNEGQIISGGVPVGFADPGIDGYYRWYPVKGGYWSAEDLEDMVQFLTELNRPWHIQRCASEVCPVLGHDWVLQEGIGNGKNYLCSRCEEPGFGIDGSEE